MNNFGRKVNSKVRPWNNIYGTIKFMTPSKEIEYLDILDEQGNETGISKYVLTTFNKAREVFLVSFSIISVLLLVYIMYKYVLFAL